MTQSRFFVLRRLNIRQLLIHLLVLDKRELFQKVSKVVICRIHREVYFTHRIIGPFNHNCHSIILTIALFILPSLLIGSQLLALANFVIAQKSFYRTKRGFVSTVVVSCKPLTVTFFNDFCWINLHIQLILLAKFSKIV